MVELGAKDTEAFDRLAMFLSTSSAHEDMTQQVIQHGVAPTLATAPTFADSIGSSNAGQPGGNDQQLSQKMDATLNQAAPVWKPTEKLNSNTFANNTQANRAEGQAKTVDATAKMTELRSNVQDLAKKMDGGPAAPQGAESGKSLTGMAATEVAFAAVGLPGVGLAAAVVGAAAKAMLAPNINIEGQGTLSSQKSSSEYTFIDYRKGGSAMYKPAPAPAPQMGGSSAANTVMNKLNNGPGFGNADVLGGRASLSGENLRGISMINLDKTLEKSPAMQQYTAQMEDGQTVEKIHRAMQKNGLENEGGKQSVPEPMQQAYKAPQGPAIPTFYT